MSKPAVLNSARQEKIEFAANWSLVLALFGIGLVCMLLPVQTFEIMLGFVCLLLMVYGGCLLFTSFFHKQSRRSELIFGLLAIGFAAVLLFNAQLPEWIIRVTFGWYCFGVAICLFVQICIHYSNHVKIRLSSVLFCIIYALLSAVLLFTRIVNSEMLFRLFGIYFLLLAGRMFIGLINVHNTSYSWKRRFHIGLPMVLGTLLPDAALKKINEKVRNGESVELDSIKKDTPAKLKAIVHIGEDGFQKVGHFTFSWKGMVYSYGNYDAQSERFFTMIGDGVYFTVPEELYFPNLVKHEHNTLFEYTIQTTPEQDEKIEQQLKELHDRSIRWYCQYERMGIAGKLKAWMEKDYPSRLHYRTGAKFYKLKRGSFKTYWVAGDNCVLFSDVILGSVGAGVLSLRGIVTPGSYYDYLEGEYQKENSPVIERKIHNLPKNQQPEAN